MLSTSEAIQWSGFVLAAGFALVCVAANAQPCKDVLFIGDNADNTVEMFDVITGEYLGPVEQPSGGNIRAPAGLIIADIDDDDEPDDELLLMANQNVNVGRRGEVLAFDPSTGDFLDRLISSSDADAPFAPRGIVEFRLNLFVASFTDHSDGEGAISIYDATTGTFLGEFDTTGFTGEFHPRGLVIGPDGYLYVSNTNYPDRLGGSILRFDPNPDAFEFVNVVVDSTTCCKGDLQFNRPEGLVFGPDGRLYVTSFNDPNHPEATVDGILVFNIVNGKGKLVDKIPFYEVGELRSFAQALLFGPDGDLYVPISGGADAGSVRVYEPRGQPEAFTTFIEAGGPLSSPQYLTFCETDPSTLVYGGN